MMLSLETLNKCLIDEVKEIIDANYAETAHFDIPLDIDWDAYLSIGDSFKAFVLRNNDGEIVGILFFIVTMYPHIKTLSMAQQVTFYVKHDYRKHALSMVRKSEEYFTDLGINLIIQSARYDTDFCKVLEAKKYEATDVTYVKRVN